MIFWILPFLTSLGALLFEFSLSHFLPISTGNSSFGYSFVIGVFLFFMGLGAFGSERLRIFRAQPASTLITVELLMSLLCLLALPALSYSSGVFKGSEFSEASCRSLVCDRAGILLIFEAGVFLALTGFLVGTEIPLFLTLSREGSGKILAADYFGAFVAGLLFPLLLLPRLGSLGTLILGGVLHLFVATFAWVIFYKRKLSQPYLKLSFVVILWLVFVGAFAKHTDLEEWLLPRILDNPMTQKTDLIFYKRTHKQSVVITKDVLSAPPLGTTTDTRLYLEGYLQFSSLWNMEAYHKTMALPARQKLASSPARVLILGGGDGLLAQTLHENNSQDEVLVVDFDCELLEMARSPGPLNELSKNVWTQPHVSTLCADAFWFVLQTPQEPWDLVLVDFPHGVGDAAAERVESFEFFRDLHRVIKPGGYVVLQHENYGSESQRCVAKTLQSAGFATEALAVTEDTSSSEAMILGRRTEFKDQELQVAQVQTQFRSLCSRMNSFGKILSGI